MSERGPTQRVTQRAPGATTPRRGRSLPTRWSLPAGTSGISCPRTLGIGLLCYGSVGRAHINAYRKLPWSRGRPAWPPAVVPELRLLCGRNQQAVSEAAIQYGFARTVTGWRDLVDDTASALCCSVAMAPYGATFLDGYRNAVVADGIVESSLSGQCVTLEYEA